LLGNLSYYFHATYRRKLLDKILESYKGYYRGVVLDIGGRERGRFDKPKHDVVKWIYADIAEYKPDVILDITKMNTVNTRSIDVINVIEVFEHLVNPEQALQECYRILRINGKIILSSPFLYPIHADPYDMQRWTEERWRIELGEAGFYIEKIEIMGFFFTIIADFIKIYIRTLPFYIKWLLLLLHPVLDAIAMLDKCEFIKKHPRLNKFHGGYFIIAIKKT